MSTATAPSDPDARAYAARKRAEKREAAEEIGVDAGYIDRFVETFYARIRDDDMLGPIFDARIANWPAHLARMKAFWRSVLHNSGEFSGNPMLKHIVIPGISLTHFSHWLDLFYATLQEWPAQNKDKNRGRATYVDFLSARSGRDLRPWFEAWLMSGETPAS